MKKINQFISGTFLEGLLNELAKINEKDFIEPDCEIKPDETVIDEMNRFEKAVLTWFRLNLRKIPPTYKRNCRGYV